MSQNLIGLWLAVCLVSAPGCKTEVVEPDETPVTGDDDDFTGDDDDDTTEVPFEPDYWVDAILGDDETGDGSAEFPWATIQHAADQLVAGEEVGVRPGNYPEEVSLTTSGTADELIRFTAEFKGEAVLQGGDLVTGWAPCSSEEDCLGAPQWAQMYKASVTEGAVSLDAEATWLTEADEALRLAIEQDTGSTSAMYQIGWGMKPLVDGRNAGSCDRLYDPSIDAPDDYYVGASLWIWAHVPANIVVHRTVTGWDNTDKSFTLDPPFDPGECLAFDPDPPRSDAYILVNHPEIVREPGDYVISDLDNGTRDILLWPRDAANLDQIHISTRQTAFDITASHVVVDGFKMANYAIEGRGATVNISGGVGVTLRNNELVAINDDGVQVDDGAEGVLFEYNIIRDAIGMGIQFLGASNGMIVGNYVDNTEHTSVYFAGEDAHHFVVAGNVIGRQGQHGNATAAYQCAGEILWVDNRFIDTNVSLTTNPCTHDLYIFRNVFEGGSDSVIGFWGGEVLGEVHVLNNAILHASPMPAKSALATSDNPGASSYIWQNNYIASSCDWDSPVVREYNGWKDDEACWNQAEAYGWELNATEWESSDLGALFEDAAQADYRPRAGSLLSGGGTSNYAHLPVDLFPEFYFGPDCASWDIGPYTCGFGPEVGRDSGVSYALPVE